MQINVAKVNKRKFDEKKFSSAPEFLRDGWFRVAGKIRGGKVFTIQPKTNFYSRKVRFSNSTLRGFFKLLRIHKLIGVFGGLVAVWDSAES